MKLVSWNMAHRKAAWYELLETGADIALLQEAAEPPSDVVAKVAVDSAPWQTYGADAVRPWRTAVVKLSDSIDITWLNPVPLEQATAEDLPVSQRGTLAVAKVRAFDGESFLLASMYGLWERPHPAVASNWIYADAAVHRVISDLAALVGRQQGHNIIAAGDLNILYGYGEDGSPYWASRYGTVFQRLEAMGLPFVGPQFPNGRQATPWPRELPPDSKNVPTYYTVKQAPAEATRQLDFVFATSRLSDRITVQALNSPEEWGGSDHCKIVIEIK
jgi:hypothetical protein